MKHHVCRYELLEREGKISIHLDNKPIVVVRSEDGSAYALRDVCPHKGPCLSDGMMDKNCHGSVTGEYLYDRDTEVLRCPWHSWEFDIRTGRSMFAPENVRVKTYPVIVENGDVYVNI